MMNRSIRIQSVSYQENMAVAQRTSDKRIEQAIILKQKVLPLRRDKKNDCWQGEQRLNNRSSTIRNR